MKLIFGEDGLTWPVSSPSEKAQRPQARGFLILLKTIVELSFGFAKIHTQRE
jgi:hypothetical protein